MRAILAAALTASVLSFGLVSLAHAENSPDGKSSTTANDTLLPFGDSSDGSRPTDHN